MTKVTITDRDGWRKDVSLQKAIVYIGSDPASDIVLDGIRGAGVAPRHAQLLTMPSNGQGARLVNLGPSDITVGMGMNRTVAAFSSTALAEGEAIRIGDFTLTISGMEISPVYAALPGAAAPAALPSAARAALPAAGESSATPDIPAISQSIGLRLSLPDMAVTPDRPIEGTIVIKNQGSRPGAQFKLQVDGIDSSLYEIGPGPILFPNAEKEVFLRFVHPHKPNPPAGDCRIVVRVSSPDAYPGEVSSANYILKIAPFFEHKLRVISAA
jgi:hypothetical protein